jgi:hypothetical protein
MSKELWMAAHQELVEEYLLDHPDADRAEAYDKTADFASDRCRDKFADMVDAAKQRAKDEGNRPPKANAGASASK